MIAKVSPHPSTIYIMAASLCSAPHRQVHPRLPRELIYNKPERSPMRCFSCLTPTSRSCTQGRGATEVLGKGEEGRKEGGQREPNEGFRVGGDMAGPRVVFLARPRHCNGTRSQMLDGYFNRLSECCDSFCMSAAPSVDQPPLR